MVGGKLVKEVTLTEASKRKKPFLICDFALLVGGDTGNEGTQPEATKKNKRV